MQIRQIRDSLVLSVTGIAEKDVRPGRTPSTIRGTSFAHVLSEGDKENKQRKRCRGCYEKIFSERKLQNRTKQSSASRHLLCPV